MNGSTTTVNGAAVNGTNGVLNGIGAAPRTATLGTPSSYAYTSSGSLLGRGAAARPVPPPTLPKYSGSFSAGSTATALRERDRDGTGGSHRLASLERLALRQRIIEQSANNQVSTGLIINTPANGGPTSATVTLTDTATVSPLVIFLVHPHTNPLIVVNAPRKGIPTTMFKSAECNRLHPLTYRSLILYDYKIFT